MKLRQSLVNKLWAASEVEDTGVFEVVDTSNGWKTIIDGCDRDLAYAIAALPKLYKACLDALLLVTMARNMNEAILSNHMDRHREQINSIEKQLRAALDEQWKDEPE